MKNDYLLVISDSFDVWLLSLLGFKATAMECLEALASGLYSEVFTVLISFINRLVYYIFDPGFKSKPIADP